MAQGKTKIKAKLPANAKHKSNKTNKKNSAFTKRKSKLSSFQLLLVIKHLPTLILGVPVQKKMLGKLKIQAAITKSVNQKNEDVMRSRAISTKQILSKAQLAVKEHHEKKSTEATMTVE